MFITRNNNMSRLDRSLLIWVRIQKANQEIQQRADIIDHTKVMNQYIAGNAFCLRVGWLRAGVELSIGKQTESG